MVARVGRSAGYALGLGAVSWAWSEVGFWAHFRTDDQPGTWVLTWLVYSLVTALVLYVAQRFPARDLATVVLLGSVYGWLVEGVLAGTLYGALPVSVIWTGVAWHALLTVGVGWFGLPLLARRGGWTAAGAGAGVGLAWGVWSALWWGAEPDQGQAAVTPRLGAYLAFVAVVSAAAAAGYLLMGRCAPAATAFTSRRSLATVVAGLAAWGCAVVFVAAPWAPVVLGLLLWTAWTALRRLSPGSGAAAVEPDRVPSPPTPGFAGPAGLGRAALPALAAVPVTAVATYAALVPLAPEHPGAGLLHAGFVGVVVLLGLAGTLALAGSLLRAWRSAATRRQPGGARP